MHQDEQLSTPSLSRAHRRSSSSLRKPLAFVPFDENHDVYGGEGHSSTETLPGANMLVAGTQTPHGLPFVPNTDVPNEESPVFPDTLPFGKHYEESPVLLNPSPFSKHLYNLPSIDVYGDVPRHTLSNYTPGKNLFSVPDTPANEIEVPFGLSHINYDELDERLEEELDFSNMSTVRLMQISGLMQAISRPVPAVKVSSNKVNTSTRLPYSSSQAELFERLSTQPAMAAIVAPTLVPAKPAWKAFLGHPAFKLILGIVIGIVTLLLLSRVINIQDTAMILETHLTTTAGIVHACIGSVAFALAFTLRGTRWKLFLNRVSNVSVFKVIRIYWIGVFINFLLPVQGGEIAKSIMLKRVAGIPVSKSLPIVAMDKALDLMPVLIIIVIMPLIPGIHMNIVLSLVLYLVASILFTLIIIVALTWWKREVAIGLIDFFLRFIPKKIGSQIEGFGMGFVDSLIEGLKKPKSFIPAAMLTALAILSEGVFAWQVFQAVGVYSMGLGIATFGYTVFTMFSILPTPPAQVGTNEGAKSIVFGSLLGFNRNQVLSMSLLSRVIATLLMTIIGMASIWSLGLTLKGVLSMKERHEEL